ncbi:hypothetical protein [Candidatus Magnetominusculus xianensis]|uniref:Uncharacterized protein n=1 Tax=Candidatus Magnetominusculus xianensis TaxID=1748249 RepID=A0ABR5SDD2_9BACT|nr:hypothetical protein [Candidatus Magnetominusculus xianensis]KWT82925.1 hypothetical protein ASN18_2286 [Candidatus Magnetominusculus xianensis]MBF0403005.1 hypothetical protein [Nitrospirota bacterium]
MLLKDMTVEQLEDIIGKKFDERLNDFFFDVGDYAVALERSKAEGRENLTSQEIKKTSWFIRFCGTRGLNPDITPIPCCS